jgi:polygalacturonase
MGNIVDPEDLSDWTDKNTKNWLVFIRVDGLPINGEGIIDGYGANWWKSCPKVGEQYLQNCFDYKNIKIFPFVMN